MEINIEALNMSEFFFIYEAMNKDQYSYKRHPISDKLVKSEVIPKEERSDEFLFEIYREIVNKLSGLTKEYTNNNTFVELAIDKIQDQYSELYSILTADFDDSSVLQDSFDFKGDRIVFEPFKEWTFNKWVILENSTKGKSEISKNGELEVVESGMKFILPICFGEWFDEMPNFKDKFSYFNEELPAKEALPSFVKANSLISRLKDAHGSIYGKDEDEDDGKSKSYRFHVEKFGWQETLKSLSEKRVFGNYLDLKSAPMLQVLEYLNCSISSEQSKAEDYQNNNRKKP